MIWKIGMDNLGLQMVSIIIISLTSAAEYE